MRFTKQKSLREHYLLDTKIEKTKFLWLPITIGSETRWLEKTTMIYEVRSLGDFLRGYYFQWTAVKFINK